jgi:hypothetical protein
MAGVGCFGNAVEAVSNATWCRSAICPNETDLIQVGDVGGVVPVMMKKHDRLTDRRLEGLYMTRIQAQVSCD